MWFLIFIQTSLGTLCFVQIWIEVSKHVQPYLFALHEASSNLLCYREMQQTSLSFVELL